MDIEKLIQETRKKLVEETINLLKSAGYKEGMRFEFSYTRILHKTNENGYITIILADIISFVETGVSEPFYMVYHGDDYVSNCELTIDSLIDIYYAVKYDSILKLTD